jgi:DNA recombination protein RmuC
MVEAALVAAVIVTGLVAIAAIAILRVRSSAGANSFDKLVKQLEVVARDLDGKFVRATADMAERLSDTKGDLRQETADRIAQGFLALKNDLEQQLKAGREEQAGGLKLEIAALTSQMRDGLESVRFEIDQKLLAITNQVQSKLDQNIREGFAQFEKVQQHLKNAEEQLREVGALGHSINDLNNLLKLPHLRGQFGEASLERLLADFLPAHMFALQSSPGEGGGRADAVIYFPDRKLPIDAKFPREQVIALFESNDKAEIEAARIALVRVMKAEAKRIQQYIQPENGTTEIALMYLPSETLYMEVIRNRELGDWMNEQHVFPVSPNTLLMTLHTISLVHKWYEVATRFEKSRAELAKAQKSFDFFQSQFENVGKNLNKAQEAFETAQRHLKNYRGKVTALSGQEQLELETSTSASVDKPLPLLDKASA